MTHKLRLLHFFAASAILLFACGSLTDVTPEPTTGQATAVATDSSGLPDMPNKPEPVVETFKGCPPEGDGGDPDLNRLKNRSDGGNYIPVEFNAILQLTWPQEIERRDRANWSAEDTGAIAKYEGLPVAVEGYLAGAKKSGPESTNCHSEDYTDYHVWLTGEAVGNDRTQSIVVEPTPRTLDKHPAWTTKLLNQIAKDQLRVRISGWTFFDPEHPDQIGKTRGTIWEIHPVMQIEVNVNNQWLTVDDYAAGQ